MYKFNQDHLELFFGSIRGHSGHNNNPIARQFCAAYKKLLIYSEMKEGSLGNCILLDQIQILNYSSVKNNIEPENLINLTNLNLYDDVESDKKTYHLHDMIMIISVATTLQTFVQK